MKQVAAFVREVEIYLINEIEIVKILSFDGLKHDVLVPSRWDNLSLDPGDKVVFKPYEPSDEFYTGLTNVFQIRHFHEIFRYEGRFTKNELNRLFHSNLCDKIIDELDHEHEPYQSYQVTVYPKKSLDWKRFKLSKEEELRLQMNVPDTCGFGELRGLIKML